MTRRGSRRDCPARSSNAHLAVHIYNIANRTDDALIDALAWLLQRSPNLLLIPGTSSVTHLRENAAGAGLTLPTEALAELDQIGQ